MEKSPFFPIFCKILEKDFFFMKRWQNKPCVVSSIGYKINCKKKSIEYYINGKNYGPVFENIPDYIVPAVSFKNRHDTHDQEYTIKVVDKFSKY